jgi:hypothetical protein
MLTRVQAEAILCHAESLLTVMDQVDDNELFFWLERAMEDKRFGTNPRAHMQYFERELNKLVKETNDEPS